MKKQQQSHIQVTNGFVQMTAVVEIRFDKENKLIIYL